MKRSVGIIIVVVLVAVGVVGVVFAGAKSSEKTAGIGNSVVVPVSSQQGAKASEKVDGLQDLAVSVSPEPCLMVLVGIGGLIVLLGKKRRRRSA